MAVLGIPLLMAILVWWLSTGLIMRLVLQSRASVVRAFAGATVAAIAAGCWLVFAAWNGNPYLGFASAVVVWGWIEMGFLTGIVTGPSTAPCPADATGWRRFRLALDTVLYHELSIAGAAAVIVALTWKAPEQTGTLAFLILMAMRISAKLNIYLGVPNLTVEFLPARLSYLKTYFRKRDFNLLFPISIAGSVVAAIALGQRMVAAGGAEATGFALLFALMALAILEHFFMMLPLPDAVLWRWAVPSNSATPKSENSPKQIKDFQEIRPI